LNSAFDSERPHPRQELSFKSPKCERIERLVVADSRLSHRSILVQYNESLLEGGDPQKPTRYDLSTLERNGVRVVWVPSVRR